MFPVGASTCEQNEVEQFSLQLVLTYYLVFL